MTREEIMKCEECKKLPGDEKIHGYCSSVCKDKAFERYKGDSETFEKRLFAADETIAELQVKLLLKQVEASKKDADAPKFLSELQQQTWFYCAEGNCDSDKHSDLCTFCICSPEATHQLILFHRSMIKQETKLVQHLLEYNGAKYRVKQGFHPDDLLQERIDTKMVRRLSYCGNLVPDLFFWQMCAKAWNPSLTSTPQMSEFVDRFFQSSKLKKRVQTVEAIYHAKNYLMFNLDYHTRAMKISESKKDPRLIFAFHGFGDSNIKSILEDGLHLYFSNKGQFSRGIYFSTSPDVCDEFYSHSTTRSKAILLCLVNVGTCHHTTSSETWDEDALCQKEGRLLDSVGFIHHGAQAYVVPSSSQVYPLALITYKRT
jgi:hypothetical protein